MEKLKDLSFKIVGVTFPNSNGSSRQEIISKINLLSTVELVREPHNEYDPNAIAVYVEGEQVGFLSSEEAVSMASLMDSGTDFHVIVEDIGVYKGKNFMKILVNEV
jgi:hypothetical protein